MRPAARVARLAAGLLLLASRPGTAQERASVDLWPFLVRDGRPVAGLRTTRVGGPLFESWQEPDGDSGWSLRPLLAGIEERERERRELEFLYPLGSWRRDARDSLLRLTPFVDVTRRGTPGSEAERRGWTFLTAFGGRTPGGERYGGVFPLAGVAKQRFGLERLDFLLFPLFARSRHPSGYRRTTLLWPFFSWGSGGGRKTLRIWPFYGHDLREGESERRFFLWPLVHFRTDRSGQPDERRVRLFLPFYGESRRRNARAHFVLGPLYMSARNETTGERTIDLLWPFVRYSERPARGDYAGSSELRLEPFLRRKRAPGLALTGTLFGAIRSLRLWDETSEHESFRVLFVSRYQRVRQRESGARQVRLDVWPFFQYRERRDGAGSATGRLGAPWPLPLSGGGWQRHGLGLLTWYERRWRDDEVRSDWLFGLARQRRADDYRLDAVSWLYRHERRGEGGRRLRILGLPLQGLLRFD